MVYDVFFILWNAVFFKMTDKFTPDPPWNRYFKVFYAAFFFFWIAYFLFDLHRGRIWM
jgi:hypothetical protein